MKKVLPLFISVIVLVLNIMSVNASENVLRGVDVKSGENSYTIELTTNEPAKMSKTIISSNRVLITLDDVKASSNITTKYDNNAVIDNVIIEPQGNEGVSIMLQGDNIAYSDVTFKAPTSLKQIEGNMVDTVSAVVSLSDLGSNKTIPGVLLIVLVGIMVAEIRFIKSKYKELNTEKSLMEIDIERTSEFKEHMTGYGNQGLTKPYTTPIYSNPKDSSLVRANYLKRLQNLQTPETVTLNSLLSDNNKETNIINKVINKSEDKVEHVFGSLSNLMIERKELASEATPMTNPVSRAKLNSQLAHLETLSKLYQQASNENDDSLQKRLNSLY